MHRQQEKHMEGTKAEESMGCSKIRERFPCSEARVVAEARKTGRS